MVESTTEKFIEQLKLDTIDKVITWTNLELVPEGFFQLSANLPTILFEHAHNVVIKKMSYRASNNQNGFIYFITRRVQSMKDGNVGNEYYLYVQRNELEDCLQVKAKRSSLIELATIIRNVSSNETLAEEKQLNDFMSSYLANHSEYDIDTH